MALSLRPFATPAPAGAAQAGAAGLWRLSATVEPELREQETRLRFHYSLEGPIDQLVVPAPLPQTPRHDDLWQHTCFEAFLARPGSEAYWELNLAPSGAWNLYRLDGYRRNLRPDPACRGTGIRWRADAQKATLEACLSLPPELAAEAGSHANGSMALDVGLTAVLERQDGQCEYWALCHAGSEADFHRRESFSLRLRPAVPGAARG